ncbi:MAG: two-component sensor histidine kinase, partial [Verrucomicrobiaceae bacterium]
GEVVITIADLGPGVPEESLPHLFDPFFRVDTARTRETGGVGLGLTIAKTCVEACHGTISAHPVSPSGLQVTIRVPRSTAAPEP